MLIINPLAPEIEVSSNGLEIAVSAAVIALSFPCALATPICAYPASFIMVLTSAKSKLINPDVLINSAMLLTPCFKTSGLRQCDEAGCFCCRNDEIGIYSCSSVLN
jgi:hypothetical protein